MKKNLFLIFFVITGIVNGQSPNWVWAQSAGGASSEEGSGIATDINGNVYVAGLYFSSTITFGTYTLTNNGNYDTYLVKYDALGNVLWAKSAGGAFDDVSLSVATDPSGNIYITGYYTSSTLLFGTYTLTNSGAGDIFIAKYDGAGNVLWAKTAGGSNNDNGNSIATDATGNVYITGDFQSSTMSFGTNTLTNMGSSDVYLAKYDPSGNVLWAQTTGDNLYDISNAVTTDPGGNVWITGYYKSATLTFGTFTLNNSASGSGDIFITKFSASGIPLWCDTYGDVLEDVGNAICSDANGNVYLTGNYKSPNLAFGTITFTNVSAGSCDVYITKYNNAGSILWAKSAGGNFDDTGTGVTTDAGGNVYITGHVHSTSITFGTYTVTCFGVGDGYVAKYNGSGAPVYAISAGGISDDGTSSITADAGGNVYVTGYFFSNTISFGTYTLNLVASSDMFVAKIGSTLDIKEIASQNPISLYPNPSNGLFEIKGKGIIAFEIYNSLGEKIDHKPSTFPVIDLSGNAKGIYFISVRLPDGILTKKMIVN